MSSVTANEQQANLSLLVAVSNFLTDVIVENNVK